MAWERFFVFASDETWALRDGTFADRRGPLSTARDIAIPGAEWLEAWGVRAVFALYMVDANKATHLCSITPSAWCVFVGIEIVMHEIEGESERDYDERRDHVEMELLGQWSAHDDSHYTDWSALRNLDPRFRTPDRVFRFKAEWGEDPEAYDRRVEQEALESFSANPDEPAILGALDAWEAEQQALRRAEMLPVLDRRGDGPLPLFQAAWGALWARWDSLEALDAGAAMRHRREEAVRLGWTR